MPSLTECSSCPSKAIYQYKEDIEYTGAGEELLPKLGNGAFGVAKIRPIICADCGAIRLIASSETIANLENSNHWQKL